MSVIYCSKQVLHQILICMYFLLVKNLEQHFICSQRPVSMVVVSIVQRLLEKLKQSSP